MIRNQFTFYRSFYESLMPLAPEERANIILAICAYALYEEEPAYLSSTESACFNLVRPILDAGRKKAAAGRKGGEANAKQGESESTEEADPKQGDPESKYKDKYKDKDKDKDKNKKKNKDNSLYPPYPPFPEGSPSQELGRAWNEILNNYPQDHIGDQRAAEMAYKKAIKSPEEANQMLRNLGQWLQTEQWTKENGRYIPQLANWIGRGTWAANPPRPAIPQASCTMGLAELDSIWQTMGLSLEQRDAKAEEWRKEHPEMSLYG